MPEQIEALTAVLEADIRKFEKGMGDAFKTFDKQAAAIEKRQESMMRKLQSGFGLSSLGNTILGGAALYGVERFVSSIAESVTKIATTAQAIGVGTDALQEWGAIAEKSGVDQESFNTSLDRFAKSLGEAQIKGGPLAAQMKALGVDIHASTETAFLQFADAVANTGNQSQKTALVVQLLGRNSAGMVPFMQQGAAAIRAQGDEIKRTGGIIDQEGIRKIKEAEIAWTELKRQLTVTGANALSGFTDEFSQFAEQMKDPAFQASLKQFGAIMADVAAIFAKLAPALPEITGALIGLRVGGPTGALVGAIGGFAAKRAKEAYDYFHPNIPNSIDVTPSQIAKPGAGLDRSNLLAGTDSGRAIAEAAAQAAKAYQEFVRAVDAGNVEILRGTLGVFAEIRKQIDDDAQAAKETVASERDVRLATLADEVKKGTILESDAGKIRVQIYAEAAARELTIDAQTQDRKLQNLRDEVNARFEAGQAIVEQRRETVNSEQGLLLELAKGSQDYYALARDLSDEQAKLEEQNIRDRLAHELDNLDQQKAAADKAGIAWDDYQQNRADATTAAELKIQAIQNGAATNRVRLNEEETHALADQIQLMDGVRNGLENIGTAALHGAQSFKSAVVQMIEQLAEMALKLYVLQPLIESVFGRAGTNSNFLMNLLGLGSSGSATPGSIGAPALATSGIGSIGSFAGGYASGGTLSPGTWGIAGEHGPEAIFAGSSPLSVIPKMPSLPSVTAARPQVSVSIMNQNSFAGAVDAKSMQAYADQVGEVSARNAIATIKQNFPGMMVNAQQRQF